MDKSFFIIHTIFKIDKIIGATTIANIKKDVRLKNRFLLAKLHNTK